MQPKDDTIERMPKQVSLGQNTGPLAQQFVCRADVPEERECPTCGLEMRLWAGFYRCRNCGFKESCCF